MLPERSRKILPARIFIWAILNAALKVWVSSINPLKLVEFMEFKLPIVNVDDDDSDALPSIIKVHFDPVDTMPTWCQE